MPQTSTARRLAAVESPPEGGGMFAEAHAETVAEAHAVFRRNAVASRRNKLMLRLEAEAEKANWAGLPSEYHTQGK